METFQEYEQIIKNTLEEILEACPGMTKKFYLGGTAPISILHLKHAVSLDLDIHTQKALEPTSQEAKTLKAHFKNRLQWFETDHEFGLFRGTIKTGKKSGNKEILIELDIFSNFEDTEPDQIEKNRLSQMPTLTMLGYLKSKLACVEERREAKDLYHLYCLAQNPAWEKKVVAGLKAVDQLELAANKNNFPQEWGAIRKDIRKTSGLTPLKEKDLLSWVKSLPNPKAHNKKPPCGEPTL